MSDDQLTANVSFQHPSLNQDNDYTCPYCGRQQVIGRLDIDCVGAEVRLWQCLSCREVRVDFGTFARTGPQRTLATKLPLRTLRPIASPRPALPFQFVPAPILTAYADACYLSSIHTGAAGAYARRAIELLLDGMGYQAKTILESIEKAKSETDFDKRLPKRMVMRLDYIKEIGNFALHVRRDRELAIIDIEPTEVEACLETVEELLKFVFEDPGLEYQRAVDLNTKLTEASKKPLALPDPPGSHWDHAAAEAPLVADA